MTHLTAAAHCTTTLCRQTAHVGIPVQATWAGMVIFLLIVVATVHVAVTEIPKRRRRARVAAAATPPETAAEIGVG